MNTILVVDDSRTIREKITELLSKYNFSVITAVNGAEALEQTAQVCPDVIVLDILMPVINGYEVCRSLKQNKKTANIPIIMCSIQGADSDRYWGLKQGADAYLAKPFQARELLQTVGRLLRK